ncbi:MAG: citrulline utilization hydrolase CtlX [Granulosicoccaceae bacterium]
MAVKSVQAPAAVVMIRPHHFRVNPETAADNAYQVDTSTMNPQQLSRDAFHQLSSAAEQLEQVGVKVHVFEDEGADTPDSVFPNNWFSTHSGGHVALYPMLSPARRRERRSDIIEMLKREYRVQDVLDYSGLEPDGLFLEGTGAMVLDHIERVAYAVSSLRTNPIAMERFATHFNFEPLAFEASDSNGTPVYHTNVLMCVATDFVMIGLSMLKNPQRRYEIERRFTASGREIIDLSEEQIAKFAGNAIELQGRDGRVLALSTTAREALNDQQVASIERSATLLPLHIPTIEMAGGSVRCTLAGIHLASR